MGSWARRDFRTGSKGLAILVGDDSARHTAAALRRLLPDWRWALADCCSDLPNGVGVDVFVGFVIVPQVVDREALAWFEEIGQSCRDLLWIAVLDTHHLDNPELMKAVAAICHDFITTPVEGAAQSVQGMIAHAVGFAQLRAQLWRATSETETEVGELIGRSPAMKRLRNLVAKFAKAATPVMLCGESGTGKELVARAIHQASPRANGPFVAVNCGAIPENLFESELFGHVRGAFTGAVRDRQGRAAVADGGTLLLDEIGDLALTHQVKILRFLQEGCFEPVGSPHSIKVDVRIIAATHVDLGNAVRAQKFREDLFYRLNVLQLTVPALRERGGDIAVLAEHFLACARSKTPTPARAFSSDALTALGRYSWPGNVRELINRVNKAVVMAERPLITAEDLDLPNPDESTGARIINLQETRERAERQAIEQALRDSNFNVSQAASLLGVSRMTIYRLIEKHGIDVGS